MLFENHPGIVFFSTLSRFPSQPPTVVCKMEAQLKYTYTRRYTLFTHFARLAPICMLSRCLFSKILHWSSVGSLLRVRCWLGLYSTSTQRSFFVSQEKFRLKGKGKKHFFTPRAQLSTPEEKWSLRRPGVRACVEIYQVSLREKTILKKP